MKERLSFWLNLSTQDMQKLNLGYFKAKYGYLEAQLRFSLSLSLFGWCGPEWAQKLLFSQAFGKRRGTRSGVCGTVKESPKKLACFLLFAGVRLGRSYREQFMSESESDKC